MELAALFSKARFARTGAKGCLLLVRSYFGWKNPLPGANALPHSAAISMKEARTQHGAAAQGQRLQ